MWSLDEVVGLCLAKFGEVLDLGGASDDVCDADGVSWVRTTASPWLCGMSPPNLVLVV